jgi:hypothetical protein
MRSGTRSPSPPPVRNDWIARSRTSFNAIDGWGHTSTSRVQRKIIAAPEVIRFASPGSSPRSLNRVDQFVLDPIFQSFFELRRLKDGMFRKFKELQPCQSHPIWTWGTDRDHTNLRRQLGHSQERSFRVRPTQPSHNNNICAGPPRTVPSPTSYGPQRLLIASGAPLQPCSDVQPYIPSPALSDPTSVIHFQT